MPQCCHCSMQGGTILLGVLGPTVLCSSSMWVCMQTSADLQTTRRSLFFVRWLNAPTGCDLARSTRTRAQVPDERQRAVPRHGVADCGGLRVRRPAAPPAGPLSDAGALPPLTPTLSSSAQAAADSSARLACCSACLAAAPRQHTPAEPPSTERAEPPAHARQLTGLLGVHAHIHAPTSVMQSTLCRICCADLEVAFCMSRTARSKAALQQACVYAAVSGARVSLRAALSEVGVRQSYAERRTGVPGGRGRAARRAAPPQDARAGARSCMWGSEMHRCGAQERALASATWHARLKSSRERQRLPSPRSAHLCNRAVSRS